MPLFNVRVYGILLNDKQQVLVSDELIRGGYYTKFPGGGLEFGEGTRECLQREFMEELGLRVEVKDHLYTTDFFQRSAFHPEHQILSIYYWVKAAEQLNIRLSNTEFDFTEEQLTRYKLHNEIETFRFIDWKDLNSDYVTLPIDKVVVDLIKAHPIPIL